MGLLPELAGPADLYYNEEESRNYTRSSRIKRIQMEITERAIELLEVEGHSPLFIDLGCGSGLSGQVLSKRGYEWIGVDISLPMLSIAQETSESLSLILSDIGKRLPFKEDAFDYAICISAAQWLFQSYRKDHAPIARIRTFFRSLHDIVRMRSVIQFYCGKKEIEILRSEAKKAGFHGGLVIDKEGTKNCKYFLVLSKWRPVKNTSLAKLPVPDNKKRSAK